VGEPTYAGSAPVGEPTYAGSAPVGEPTYAGSAPVGRLTEGRVVEDGGRKRSAKQKQSQISGARYRCGEVDIAPPRLRAAVRPRPLFILRESD